MRKCNVCNSSDIQPFFESGGKYSLTTMNKMIEGKTVVSYCSNCDHLQTDELPNLIEFYADDYEINVNSSDDDQLYAIIDGKEIYRSEHEASVLADKINLKTHKNVLDFGCAKAPTLLKLLDIEADVKPFLFDVTDKYVSYWEQFPKSTEWCTHTLNPEWADKMDVVLSFFALEHIPNLSEILVEVKNVLRDGGIFCFLVPNILKNPGDFVVVDHVNHFSKSSILQMMTRAGFCEIEIDDDAYKAAFVVRAKVDKSAIPEDIQITPELESIGLELASFWGGVKGRIQSFEADLPEDSLCAIYGAGFYGNFVFSCLKEPERVVCFLDQNKFLAGGKNHGIPVYKPAEMPEEINALFAGINPKSARGIISQVPNIEDSGIPIFFFE